MKIAYITTEEVLGPSNTGGVQCCKRNLNLLKQAFGEENVYICAITKNREFLANAPNNVAAFFSNRSKKIYILKNILSDRLMFDKNIEDSILKHISTLPCDAAFFDFSRMGLLQERLSKRIKQILFMHNIEKDYIKNQIRAHPSRIVLKRAFEQNEALAVKNADKIISLNSRDASQLNKYYGRNPDLILPITMDDHFIHYKKDNGQKRHTSKLQLLFVGSLFPPNEHGITWFVSEVSPHINAEFTVVGKGFEKLASKLQRNNVNIVGTVDDLSQYYHRAEGVVSPILFGDGMKVKTAEALMYGKPMFATDEALEGYCIEGQENIFRCNSPSQFIAAINAYAERPQRIHCDDNIRALFLEKYHTPSYIPAIRKLLTEAIAL